MTSDGGKHMTLTTQHNLYPGVNAHLNSYLQDEPGGWESFHSEHIIDIARVLNDILPAGYYVRPEKTLQIREAADPPVKPLRTTPDVTVYRVSTDVVGGVAAAPEAGTKTLPLIETFSEEDLLTGLVIYQDGEAPGGRAITRIELLSPGNKPPGAHHEQYRLKRRQTLESGLRMIEIDYLHQSRPWIEGLPSYPDGEPDAYPYYVITNDPRPTFERGVSTVYRVAVDTALPTITIPLAGADSVRLDLNLVYRRTFEGNRFYSMVVDYDQSPARFEAYVPEDQIRIQALLQFIRARRSAPPNGG